MKVTSDLLFPCLCGWMHYLVFIVSAILLFFHIKDSDQSLMHKPAVVRDLGA